MTDETPRPDGYQPRFPDRESPGHIQLGWLRTTAHEMSEDYARIFARTSGDRGRTQEGGHEVERAWAEFLGKWLPPSYEVAIRRYVIGEVHTDVVPFETDIVVFRPSYPSALRNKAQVLAAGVAAAFSVKSTLRAAHIAEAAESCARLQRSLAPRDGTMRRDLIRPFPYGLLAHSHSWKLPGSEPATNISAELIRRDQEFAAHPKESIDLICVPDIGTWTKFTSFVPALEPQKEYINSLPQEMQAPMAATFATPKLNTFHVHTHAEDGGRSIAVFLTALYSFLAMGDPNLEGLARSFSLTGGYTEGSGVLRAWNPNQVLAPATRASIQRHPNPQENGEHSHTFGSMPGYD